MIHRRIFLFSAAGLLASGLLAAQVFRPEALQIQPQLAERAGALAGALSFPEWRGQSGLYPVPEVGRALFDEPAALSEAVSSCTAVRFSNEPWDRCVWSWSVPGESGAALDLEITLAPSARAAQEYLLTTLADNTMPTEVLVKLYGAARQPASVGDVAFLVEPENGSEARLSFTRANVAFRIRAFGALRGEALVLAQRLDEKLLGQQPLTLEQLRAQKSVKR